MHSEDSFARSWTVGRALQHVRMLYATAAESIDASTVGGGIL
jgi:hypothetical protein